MNRTIWHGSKKIIREPIYGFGKIYNDYGLGFYCTENKELAMEWACTEDQDGIANAYRIDFERMNMVNLAEEQYNVLNWLALLTENRIFHPTSAVARQGKAYLRDNFLPDVTKADVIVGYRADDSYFSFAKAFLNNEISIKQLLYAMQLGKLGEQIVLKSEAAFECVIFEGYEVALNQDYYIKKKERDQQARTMYGVQANIDDIDGLYMRDIIREKVQSDDIRLR